MNSVSNAGSILVVDDDQMSRELVALKLVQAGFVTTLAARGEEAMDCLDLAEFDAVVTDVRMPGMSGIQLLRNIRLRFPWLPVILMTGLIEEDIREGAMTWGARALFQKPVKSAVLITAIKAAVEDSVLRAGFLAEAVAMSRQDEAGIALASLSGEQARRATARI